MFNLRSKLPAVLLLASLGLIQSACNKGDVDPEYVGNWYQKSVPDFEGISRRSAVAFTINGKGYMGTGYSADGDRLKDFWEYDATYGKWTQIEDFGGTARHDAVAFSIGENGYVGTGYDGNYTQDFWQYSTATQKWKLVAPMPGGTTGRQYATAFVLNGKAYVGLGYDGNFKQDFYEYTPNATVGTWTSVTSFTGGKRRGASAFTANGRAFVGFGNGNSNVTHYDLYEYLPDATGGKWVEKAELTDYPRAFAVSMGYKDKGYIIGGINGSAGRSDVWEYDPAGDTWTQKTSFEGGARSYSAGFALDFIYFGTGSGGGTALDDFWGFDPTVAQVDND